MMVALLNPPVHRLLSVQLGPTLLLYCSTLHPQSPWLQAAEAGVPADAGTANQAPFSSKFRQQQSRMQKRPAQEQEQQWSSKQAKHQHLTQQQLTLQQLPQVLQALTGGCARLTSRSSAAARSAAAAISDLCSSAPEDLASSLLGMPPAKHGEAPYPHTHAGEGLSKLISALSSAVDDARTAARAALQCVAKDRTKWWLSPQQATHHHLQLFQHVLLCLQDDGTALDSCSSNPGSTSSACAVRSSRAWDKIDAAHLAAQAATTALGRQAMCGVLPELLQVVKLCTQQHWRQAGTSAAADAIAVAKQLLSAAQAVAHGSAQGRVVLLQQLPLLLDIMNEQLVCMADMTCSADGAAGAHPAASALAAASAAGEVSLAPNQDSSLAAGHSALLDSTLTAARMVSMEGVAATAASASDVLARMAVRCPLEFSTAVALQPSSLQALVGMLVAQEGMLTLNSGYGSKHTAAGGAAQLLMLLTAAHYPGREIMLKALATAQQQEQQQQQHQSQLQLQGQEHSNSQDGQQEQPQQQEQQLPHHPHLHQLLHIIQHRRELAPVQVNAAAELLQRLSSSAGCHVLLLQHTGMLIDLATGQQELMPLRRAAARILRNLVLTEAGRLKLRRHNFGALLEVLVQDPASAIEAEVGELVQEVRSPLVPSVVQNKVGVTCC